MSGTIPIKEGWVYFISLGKYESSNGIYVTQNKNVPREYWDSHSSAYQIADPDGNGYHGSRNLPKLEFPTSGDCRRGDHPDTWVIIPLHYRQFCKSANSVDPDWGESSL